tara:strand:- start:102 stop:959 length:858 start_codon:yes stop_codon:yes gene_type:complete
VEEAGDFTPASISGTLLWLDPADDSTITYSSGSVPSAIEDKGYLNTAWNPTSDPALGSLSAQSFSFFGVSGSYEINTISGKGNGNKFYLRNVLAGVDYSRATCTPTGSPYNLTSGAGSAAVESDWFLWRVIYIGAGTDDALCWNQFQRGVVGSTPAFCREKPSGVAAGHWVNILGDWTSGYTVPQTPFDTNPAGYLSFIGLQSYDDSGTRKYRFTHDGVNWYGSFAHNQTNATPSASYNVWRWGLQGTDRDIALGDCGFVSGTISAADMLSLYNYLDAKWGFDLP